MLSGGWQCGEIRAGANGPINNTGTQAQNAAQNANAQTFPSLRFVEEQVAQQILKV